MEFSRKARAGYGVVRIRNAAAIPETLKELGVDPDDILRRAGIDPALFSDPDNVLPYAALGRLVGESLRSTRCDDFGLRVGARMGPTAIGLPGLVSLHAPTVRDALKVIAGGLRTSDTGGAVRLSVQDGVASCGYVVTAPDIEGVDQIVDGSMAILFNTMRSLCGPRWRPMRVSLTRDPPRDRARFATFFGAPVDYAARAAALVFDAAILEAPVPGRNPDVAAILAPIMEEAVARSKGDFVATVKSVIRGQIGSGELSRECVTRTLGLNARTFAHRLRAAGLTYSELADEARFDAARRLLARDRPIAEVAAALGFAEQSGFTRAFKAWSGTTPARWRAERGGREGTRPQWRE